MARLNDDEMLQLFIVESKEHLEGIENDLLTIEEQGEQVDAELVHKVFRSIHTIKGAAGFFDLRHIKELAHTMENILDRIRRGKVVPTSAVVSALLNGADCLATMVDDPMTSNDTEIDGLVKALKDALNPTLPKKQRKALDKLVPIHSPEGRKIFEVNQLELENALKAEDGRSRLYLGIYDLHSDIESRGKSTMDIIADFQELTHFIDSKMDLDAAQSNSADNDAYGIPFFALFTTDMEPQLLAHFLDIRPDQLVKVPDEELEAAGVKVPHSSSSGPGLLTPLEEDSVQAAPQQSRGVVSGQDAEPATEPVAKSAVEPAPADAAGQSPAAALEAQKSGESTSELTEQEARDARTATASRIEQYIRVNVNLLDRLMNLAGELVLTRNQLLQSAGNEDMTEILQSSQRVDHITSELQEAIMSTRMQNIGLVFNKFQRIVRDLSKALHKEVRLVIEGEDVELDKTIIESIGDPLTHLVRNALDHGIEAPEEREAAGKERVGLLKLSAFHEAGQVIIEITDDGGGIPVDKVRQKALDSNLQTRGELAAMSDKEIYKLIFRPGFSTAETLTDVSGRGVGMDVVHTNLNRLGGVIDIDSEQGKGTTFRIKLPLTLAIIPSLLVSVQHEKFAIPQVNLVELVRIQPYEIVNRIEKVGGASVMRLRDKLLPLLRLREVLGIVHPTYVDPKTGEVKADRRINIADRRNDEDQTEEERRRKNDRRVQPQSAYNIAVVQAGAMQYGLIVDLLMDSSEIVVKPLGRHLSQCKIYAGATILGDGRVACILDVEGIGSYMKLSEIAGASKIVENSLSRLRRRDLDAQSLLLVKNGPEELFAIPLGLVLRIETAHRDQIDRTGGRVAIKYRGTSLALFFLEEVAKVQKRLENDTFKVIVFDVAGREMGLVVSDVVDIVSVAVEIDPVTHKQPGVFGSAIIHDKITLFVDLFGIVEFLMPDWVREFQKSLESQNQDTVLIADDSPFFLSQLTHFLQSAGYNVISASNGKAALDNLLASTGVQLVLTDLEMPIMDGFELTRQIRTHKKYDQLPIVAITGLSDSTSLSKGREAGLDDYLIKLDRAEILKRVRDFLKLGREATAF